MAKKVLFFTASTIATPTELAKIALLNEAALPQYNVIVVSAEAIKGNEYGQDRLIPSDYVAGSPPASYSARSVVDPDAIPNQAYKGLGVDFTSGSLSSYLSGTGTTHSIVQANLLECSATQNEAYYGFTQNVDYTREVFLKMKMKFGANFDFGQGQKIMRVRSFIGTQNWDFIAQITSQGNSNPGQAGRNESYQLTFSRNSGSTWGVVNKVFTREQWYTFEYRYLLNSAQGVADGAFQMWLDGVLLANYSALDLVGAGTHSLIINRILWGGWMSNGAGSNPNPNPEISAGVGTTNILQIKDCFSGTQRIP